MFCAGFSSEGKSSDVSILLMRCTVSALVHTHLRNIVICLMPLCLNCKILSWSAPISHVLCAAVMHSYVCGHLVAFIEAGDSSPLFVHMNFISLNYNSIPPSLSFSFAFRPRLLSTRVSFAHCFSACKLCVSAYECARTYTYMRACIVCVCMRVRACVRVRAHTYMCVR